MEHLLFASNKCVIGNILKVECDEFINTERMGLICRNPGNHATAEYTKLLNEGFSPRYEFIIGKLNNNKKISGKELTFYQSEKIVLEGFRWLIKRYALAAQKLYKKTGKEYLGLLTESCSWLTDDPPKSFYQAIQMMLFIHIGLLN